MLCNIIASAGTHLGRLGRFRYFAESAPSPSGSKLKSFSFQLGRSIKFLQRVNWRIREAPFAMSQILYSAYTKVAAPENARRCHSACHRNIALGVSAKHRCQRHEIIIEILCHRFVSDFAFMHVQAVCEVRIGLESGFPTQIGNLQCMR